VTRIGTSLAAGVLFAALPLHAQQVSLWLGGLRSQYADTLDARAGSAAAQLAWSGARSTGVVEASWSQFDTGYGAAQVWGSFAAMGPRSRRAGLGLRLDGVSNLIEGSNLTAIGTAELFGAAAAHGWTVTTGLRVGGVRAIDDSRFATAGATLRSWYERGFWTVGGAAAATAGDNLRYADFTATADYHHGRVVAGALAGARSGDLGGPPWYQGHVAIQMSPAVSLESAAGSYPRDLAGYNRGRYANLGLRIRISAPRPTAAGTTTPALVSSQVVVEQLDSTTTRVTFRLADTLAPAIVGSWNDWAPVPLSRDSDGRWSAWLPIGGGTYRFALVLADGRWMVPEGVTRLPDDFGGEVGVLVVMR